MSLTLSRLLDHAEMLGWLAAFRAAALGLDARALLRIPSRLNAHGAPRGDEAQLLERAARTVHRAQRLVPRARCMHRALAARVWLARRGVETTVVFGVRNDAEGLAGHAWLEPDGGARAPLTTPAERDLFDRAKHRVVLREDDAHVRRA